MKRRIPRYRVMSIPGEWDDGSDTWWFVFDWKTKKGRQVGRGNDAWKQAMDEVWKLNNPRKR